MFQSSAGAIPINQLNDFIQVLISKSQTKGSEAPRLVIGLSDVQIAGNTILQQQLGKSWLVIKILAVGIEDRQSFCQVFRFIVNLSAQNPGKQNRMRILLCSCCFTKKQVALMMASQIQQLRA